MVIFKIALIGIGGSVLALVARQFQKEYGVLVLLAVFLLLSVYLISDISVIMDFAKAISARINISETYVKILFKLLAIAFVCQISSGLCEDLGYKSISFQIEMIGKFSILILSIPIINSLLETIEQLL